MKRFLGLMLGFFLATTAAEANPSIERNLSHSQNDSSLDESVSRIKTKILQRGDLPHVTVERQLEILDSLQEFNLGRFLIQRGGLNGVWTKYWILHPFYGRLTGLNDEGQPFNEIESFLLDRSPTFLSSQERFIVFSQEMQKRLCEGCSLASLPCGLMSDLLTLDFTNLVDYRLTGIDIDEESIKLAELQAINHNQQKHASCLLVDAWKLDIEESFDILTSNGLNFYEPNDDKVIDLYRRFCQALKPGGWLVTSFLTPTSEWKYDQIVAEDALLQAIIFRDILECKWQSYRTTEQTVQQLRDAGFDEVQVIQDIRGIFPTVIARRPSPV